MNHRSRRRQRTKGGNLLHGGGRAVEASEAALARSKDLFQPSPECPRWSRAPSSLATHKRPLARISVSRHRPAGCPTLAVVAHHPPHQGPDGYHLGKKSGVPSCPILRNEVKGEENGQGTGRVPAKRLPGTPGRAPTPLAKRELSTPMTRGAIPRGRVRPLSPAECRRGALWRAPGHVVRVTRARDDSIRGYVGLSVARRRPRPRRRFWPCVRWTEDSADDPETQASERARRRRRG